LFLEVCFSSRILESGVLEIEVEILFMKNNKKIGTKSPLKRPQKNQNKNIKYT
jgi:hypothetical protein